MLSEYDPQNVAIVAAIVVVVVLIAFGNKFLSFVIADDQAEEPKGSKWVKSELVTTGDGDGDGETKNMRKQGSNRSSGVAGGARDTKSGRNSDKVDAMRSCSSKAVKTDTRAAGGGAAGRPFPKRPIGCTKSLLPRTGLTRWRCPSSTFMTRTTTGSPTGLARSAHGSSRWLVPRVFFLSKPTMTAEN